MISTLSKVVFILFTSPPWHRTCDPVYDERCQTVYKQSCHYKLVCPQYCKLAGCSDRPSLAPHCRNLKHCSRQPHTTCTPHHTRECSIKKYQAQKKVVIVTKLPIMLPSFISPFLPPFSHSS